MPKVVFGNGQTVEFENMPTQQDIEDAEAHLGLAKPPREQSMPEKANSYLTKESPMMRTGNEVVSGLTEFANPFPFAPTMKNPVPNIPLEFDKKRQLLESAGKQVKDVSQKSMGNIVEKTSELASKYLPKPLAEAVRMALAVGGGTVNLATELSPFTPSEFGATVAGAIAPKVASSATKGIQKAIINRQMQPPPSVRVPKKLKGQPTVGEEYLSMQGRKFPGSVEPTGVIDRMKAMISGKDRVNVTANSKEGIFDNVQVATRTTGNKIRNKINEVFSAGKAEGVGVSPFTKTRNLPGIRTRDIANAFDDEIAAAGSNYGIDSNEYRGLVKFKEEWLSGKPDMLDFRQANALRESLGEEIGRKFAKESGEVSEKVFAQKKMWAVLRNKIGELDPQLDEMLNLQHSLFEIRNTIAPEASLGYTKTADNVIDLLKTPFRSLRLANSLNRLPEYSKYGTALGVEAQPLSKTLEKYKK